MPFRSSRLYSRDYLQLEKLNWYTKAIKGRIAELENKIVKYNNQLTLLKKHRGWSVVVFEEEYGGWGGGLTQMVENLVAKGKAVILERHTT